MSKFIPKLRNWRLGALTASMALASLATSAAPPSAVPVDLQISVPPTAVKVDGLSHLLYEIQISNLSKQAFELSALEVQQDDAANTALASYHGDALGKLIHNPAAADGKLTTIGAGAHMVVFLDVALAAGSPVPHGLHHHLTFKLTRPDGSVTERDLDGAPVQTNLRAPLVLQAPLRGDCWLAYDLMNPDPDSHRRTLMAVNGRATVAQRFAIDWVKLGPDGRIYHDKGNDNGNWYDFGSEVLAVGDGVITAIKDGMPENIATEAPWCRLPWIP